MAFLHHVWFFYYHLDHEKCWYGTTFQFHIAWFCHMYILFSMLKTVSKLVKSTPWVLLRLWVDIRFDNGFWCTDSCTNWFTLAIFRHIQAKNHNLNFRKMCFIVNLFSALNSRYFHEIFAKNCGSKFP